MGAVILILHLGLLISFGFTESSEDHPRAEPNLDLECLNDYLTEMVCRLTSDQLETCSEYSLSVSRDTTKYELFACDFKQFNSSACECSIEVPSGFVIMENFSVNVSRRKNLLFSQNVSTTENIKPKKPFIVSVNQTKNGDFLVVWDSVYRTEDSTFSSDLITELIYYVEGNKGSIKNVTVTKEQQEYRLLGRNLESNSNYIVMARVRSRLNSRFSDYSDPYRFTTPSSPKDVLKIIIPILCIILIICIFTSYYSYNKILTEWWDKIPTPKIATSFVKQVPNLLLFQNDFSSVRLDSSKLVQPGEKTRPASSLVDVRGENSLNSLGKNGSSAEVIYGQTGNESSEENSNENNTQWELVRASQSTNLCQMPMSNKYYKNLNSNSDDCNVQSECGNSSGVSNKFYMFSVSDKFHNPAISHFMNDFNESENVFPGLAKNLDPVIPTDFEYGPCTGCSGSENASPTQFTPSSNDIAVVPGYQSINEVIDCASTDHAFISSHNDINLIMEKLICSKIPQNTSCQTTIIPVENGYKDFQSLLRNSEEQQSLTTEPELKHLCGPALHISPGIQIDSSYHRV
ncbi:uncharacterized protein il4r.2 [Pangasianodon hypophthalmus]|nr:uncharacterized protein il4r.2 [Pangasianodon hypophthalmus]